MKAYIFKLIIDLVANCHVCTYETIISFSYEYTALYNTIETLSINNTNIFKHFSAKKSSAVVLPCAAFYFKFKISRNISTALLSDLATVIKIRNNFF